MASGFSGGGPDFYGGLAAAAGRSISNMNSSISSSNQALQPPHRSQLSQIFLDPTASSQIPQHRATATNGTAKINLANTQTFIGKRTLADFQAHQQQQQQQLPNNHHHNHLSNLNSLLLRSVKPRMTYQHTCPISTLSPIEFSAHNNIISPELPNNSFSPRLPLLRQLRSHPINLTPGPTTTATTNQTLHVVPYINTDHPNRAGAGIVAVGPDPETKMLNRLQELEKQLLDDDEDAETETASVITNSNSEWSETIQNLIHCTSSGSPNPISPSPSSSSTSSSCSCTSLAAPVSRQALLEAASAISEGKTDAAAEILARAPHLSNPPANSEQRLVDSLLTALKSRVNPSENPPPVAEMYGREHFVSTQSLYDLSPCFKLGFMAANLAILEAVTVNNSNVLHVVDFEIGQGGQYKNLLYVLSERQQGKPAPIVKITAVVAENAASGGDERERLKAVGDILTQFAEQFRITLRFKVVTCSNLGKLTRDSLGCEPDEPLVVNFAFKLYRTPDESVSTDNPRDELLRRVKGLAPRVVTLVEQEMNTNTAPFAARVNEACAYYGALLESIESTVTRDSSERVKVEDGLSRRLANSVACEGRDRVERCEVFGKWRARMRMAGFELKPMAQNLAESLKSRLSSGNRVNPGFTVKDENGGVCFGWMGKTITVASAWR